MLAWRLKVCAGRTGEERREEESSEVDRSGVAWRGVYGVVVVVVVLRADAYRSVPFACYADVRATCGGYGGTATATCYSRRRCRRYRALRSTGVIPYAITSLF